MTDLTGVFDLAEADRAGADALGARVEEPATQIEDIPDAPPPTSAA